MIRDLVADLPQRFTYSDRLQDFATDKSLELLECGYQTPAELLDKIGLGNLEVISTDSTDGLRLKLSDDTYVHLRPSGNAPELRCYTEATNVQTAMALVNQVLGSIRVM
jgi:phosphomannomutase